MSATFFIDSGRRKSGCCVSSDFKMMCSIVLTRAFTYGRVATTAVCDLRSFETATIFMAFVILPVFCTLAICLRICLRFAIVSISF